MERGMPRTTSGVGLTQMGGWMMVSLIKTENSRGGTVCVCSMYEVRRRWIRGLVLLMLNLKCLRDIQMHLSLVGSWTDEARVLWQTGLLFPIPHSPVIRFYTHTLCHVTLQ